MNKQIIVLTIGHTEAKSYGGSTKILARNVRHFQNRACQGKKMK